MPRFSATISANAAEEASSASVESFDVWVPSSQVPVSIGLTKTHAYLRVDRSASSRQGAP